MTPSFPFLASVSSEGRPPLDLRASEAIRGTSTFTSVEGSFLDADDVLEADQAAPEWVREWTGPFTITVIRV